MWCDDVTGERNLWQLLGDVSTHKHGLQVDPQVLNWQPLFDDFRCVGQFLDPQLNRGLEWSIVSREGMVQSYNPSVFLDVDLIVAPSPNIITCCSAVMWAPSDYPPSWRSSQPYQLLLEAVLLWSWRWQMWVHGCSTQLRRPLVWPRCLAPLPHWYKHPRQDKKRSRIVLGQQFKITASNLTLLEFT